MTIQNLAMNCPYCTSQKVVENGHHQGKQSYLFRGCECQFRENLLPPRSYSADIKDLCIKMSLNRMGFRGIERVTGINKAWICLFMASLVRRFLALRCSLGSLESGDLENRRPLSHPLAFMRWLLDYEQFLRLSKLWHQYRKFHPESRLNSVMGGNGQLLESWCCA